MKGFLTMLDPVAIGGTAVVVLNRLSRQQTRAPPSRGNVRQLVPVVVVLARVHRALLDAPELRGRSRPAGISGLPYEMRMKRRLDGGHS